MQAALIFCSDHSGKHLTASISSGAEVSHDVNMIKQAALQYENVIPVGVDPIQLLTHKKKFGYKYDLLSRLIPAVSDSQSYDALNSHHKKVSHQVFVPDVRQALDLRNTDWWDDKLSFNREHLRSLDLSTLTETQLLITTKLLSIESQSLPPITTSYLYSILFASNPENKGVQFRSNFLELGKALGIKSQVPFLNESALSELETTPRTTYSLSFSNLPVVDLTKIAWEQVFEFRDDTGSFAAARQFRSFYSKMIYEESPIVIYDSLMADYEQYLQALKKHGLQTKIETIEELTTSKSLIGAVGLVAGSMALGEPLTAGAIALGETILEGTKVVLKVAKRKLELQELTKEYPILYLDKIAKLHSSNN